MTKMLSVRVSEAEAEALQREAERSHVSTFELLRAGLRAVLVRVAAERDAASYAAHPLAAGEVIDPSDQVWLPDEDWSSWEQRDAAR